MSDETEPRIVKQGDHGAKLAFHAGADAEEVWSHPKNQALRERRSSMDVLYPGDIVHVPSGKRAGKHVQKGTTNRFVATIPKKDVSVTLTTPEGPIANQSYRVEGLPQRPGAPPSEGTTDGEGRLTLAIPVITREVTVYFPELHRAFALMVGDMDPVDEPSGIAKRLENLGFSLPGRTKDGADLTSVLRTFQSKFGLPITGAADPATLEKLSALAGV